jgi:hypothetical protein
MIAARFHARDQWNGMRKTSNIGDFICSHRRKGKP